MEEAEESEEEDLELEPWEYIFLLDRSGSMYWNTGD